MKSKAAKLARKLNRIAGTMVKRGEERLAPNGNGGMVPVPYRLARNVKRYWDSLTGPQRGALARQWRSMIAMREPKEAPSHFEEMRAVCEQIAKNHPEWNQP